MSRPGPPVVRDWKDPWLDRYSCKVNISVRRRLIFVVALVHLMSCSAARVVDSRPLEVPSVVSEESEEKQEVTVQPGTKLASLVAVNRAEEALLPERDSEDSQPFPPWFRVFLRKSLPQLPTAGEPQYPRQAADLLQWLSSHQDFADEELKLRVEVLLQAVPSVIEENGRRARYPKEWEVDVPKGTKLDEVRKQLNGEFHLLPPKDLEDEAPLPIWFRVYLRKTNPELPTSGPYQYPRTSARILRHLLDNPNAVELPN